jgi:hypothetical protein
LKFDCKKKKQNNKRAKASKSRYIQHVQSNEKQTISIDQDHDHGAEDYNFNDTNTESIENYDYNYKAAAVELYERDSVDYFTDLYNDNDIDHEFEGLETEGQNEITSIPLDNRNDLDDESITSCADEIELSYRPNISVQNLNLNMCSTSRTRPNYYQLINKLSTSYDINIISYSFDHLTIICSIKLRYEDDNSEVIPAFTKLKIANLVLNTLSGSGINGQQQSLTLDLISTLHPDVEWPWNEIRTGDVANRLKNYLPKDYR